MSCPSAVNQKAVPQKIFHLGRADILTQADRGLHHHVEVTVDRYSNCSVCFFYCNIMTSIVVDSTVLNDYKQGSLPCKNRKQPQGATFSKHFNKILLCPEIKSIFIRPSSENRNLKCFCNDQLLFLIINMNNP